MAGLWISLVIVVGTGATMVSCVPAKERPGWSVVLDRQRELRFRLAALASLTDQELASIEARRALSGLVFGSGQPVKLRQAALDRLERLDPAYLCQELRQRLVEVDDPGFLQTLVDRMIDRNWRPVVAGVVRSYAREDRPWPDDERPERKALMAWFPGRTVPDAVWEIFCGQTGQPAVLEQAAAWELLVRLCEPQHLQARLQSLTAEAQESVLVADVHAAACQLGIFPANREDILRLMYLRQYQNGTWWDRARQRIGQLTTEQRKSLELRHLPLLVQAEDAMLEKPLSQLQQRVRARLSEIQPIPAEADPRDIDCPGPQNLEAWQERLSWADWLYLDVLLQVLGELTLVQSLLDQAQADYRDKGSEYGGVLTWTCQSAWSVQARLFDPLLRRHDRSFYPSLEMMDCLYTGLAHYHFHAQSLDNRAYAGPGRVDLKLADRLRTHGVVFTAVGKGRLNVDYYQPGGVVIDLGVVPRSAGD